MTGYQPTPEHERMYALGAAMFDAAPLPNQARLLRKAYELSEMFPARPGSALAYDAEAALRHFNLPPLERIHTDPNEALFRASHLVAHAHLHGGVRCRACRFWVFLPEVPS